MDNRSDDKNSEPIFTKKIDKLFESWSIKALFFIGVLIIAILQHFFSWGFDIDYIGRQLLWYPGFIPVRLLVILVELLGGYADEWVYGVYFFGGILFWIVYFTIMAFGIASRNLKTSKALFKVFVFLVLLNIIFSNI